MSRNWEFVQFHHQETRCAAVGSADRLPGRKFVTGEMATQSGHNKVCKVRILVDIAKDDVKGHWYVATGIDEGEIRLKEFEDKERRTRTLGGFQWKRKKSGTRDNDSQQRTKT